MRRPSPLARRLITLETRAQDLHLDRQSEADFLADVRAEWDTLTPTQRALYKGIGKRIERAQNKADARKEAWLYSPDFEQFAELALLEEIATRAGIAEKDA